MIEEHPGDLLDALDQGAVTMIGHQVNTHGLMVHGIALAIRQRYPLAYTHYVAACRTHQVRLGHILPVEVAPGRWVVHLFGQSRTWDWKRKTNYSALSMALYHLALFASYQQATVGLPWGIGCGLGGGNWAIVRALIQDALPQAILYRKDVSDYDIHDIPPESF